MKQFGIITLMVLLMTCTLSFSTAALTSTEKIAESVCQAVPTDFGYFDNTKYQMQCYFSDLFFVDDCCIMVCSDSTNFNEFGIFHVKNKENAKVCAQHLEAYLQASRSRFMSGVIYDIEEYPKFKNAKVSIIKDYVIYTILDVKETEKVVDTVKDILR